MTTKMQDGGLTAFYEKSAVVERLTELLSDSEVRVHVDGMTGNDIIVGTERIPVSRARKKAFLQAMNEYLTQ